MCLCLELGLLIFGIYALIAGQLTITRSMVVQGTPARLIGVLMIMPLPLAFGAGITFGVYWATQNRDVNDPAFANTLRIIEASIVVVCFVAMLILGAVYRGPANSPPKDRRDDLDDDDRLRRDTDDGDDLDIRKR